MKIQKKHAVALGQFINNFLEYQYYPYDAAEEEFIVKVVAFTLHHDLLTEYGIERYTLVTDERPLPKPTARLDIVEDDVTMLDQMAREVYDTTDLNGAEPKELQSATRYLLKEFPANV